MAIKHKTKLAVGILVIAVIASAAAALVWHNRSTTGTATPTQIRDALTLLKRSDGYKDGQAYLADFESGKTKFDPKSLEGASYPNYAVRIRILVDLVESLSPAQIETMRRSGALSYASLSPTQRDTLQLLYTYAGPHEIQPSDFQRSALVVIKSPGFMHLDWTVIEHSQVTKNHSYILSDMSDQYRTWEKLR